MSLFCSQPSSDFSFLLELKSKFYKLQNIIQSDNLTSSILPPCSLFQPHQTLFAILWTMSNRFVSRCLYLLLCLSNILPSGIYMAHSPYQPQNSVQLSPENEAFFTLHLKQQSPPTSHPQIPTPHSLFLFPYFVSWPLSSHPNVSSMKAGIFFTEESLSH